MNILKILVFNHVKNFFFNNTFAEPRNKFVNVKTKYWPWPTVTDCNQRRPRYKSFLQVDRLNQISPTVNFIHL